MNRKSYGINSEYKRLRKVLLSIPGPEIETIDDPEEALHLKRIQHRELHRQYQDILETFRLLKVEVVLIDQKYIPDTDRKAFFNLMYCRDLFFMTPSGAILSSMAKPIRHNEVKYAEKTLQTSGIPLRAKIEAPRTLEGADAIWIRKDLVATGTGMRTNDEGFIALQNELRKDGVRCVRLPVTWTATQHLLGVLQIVDVNLALVRKEHVNRDIIDFLRDIGITIIPVPENREVREMQAMNIVTIRPREIIMSGNCPETRKIYEYAGIRVLSEIKITQLIRAAGGLACATGILQRDM